MTPADRLRAAIHMESAAIAPQTSPLIEAAKEVLAENERLRACLSECASDLASEVEARYPLSRGDTPGRDCYPDMQRRYDRDMRPVKTARELLVHQQLTSEK